MLHDGDDDNDGVDDDSDAFPLDASEIGDNDGDGTGDNADADDDDDAGGGVVDATGAITEIELFQFKENMRLNDDLFIYRNPKKSDPYNRNQ